MQLLRLIHRSVYYAVCDALTINVKDETLTTNDYLNYTSVYKNWHTTGNVIIKKNDVVVPSGFTLNYESGGVVFSSTNISSDIIKLTYSPCSVNVVEAFPEDEIVLPTVSIENETISERPFEIGSSSTKDMRLWFYIDVFAKRSGQRTDLIDILKNYFDNDIPVYNYNSGFPINSDGTKNDSFDAETQRLGYLQAEDSINITMLRSLDMSNVEQYVGTLTVLLTYLR